MKKVAVLGGLVVMLIALAIAFDLRSNLQNLLLEIGELGPLAPVIFVVAYIFACVLFVPGSVLTLGAGILFGVVMGSVYVSIASTLGATAAFLIGRYFARGAVSRKIEGNDKFAVIDAAVGREGWKIVGLTRLSPVFPFNLLNYAYGLTRVKLRDYVLASWIGMMPGTVMFVYIGALIGDLAAVGAGNRAASAEEATIRMIIKVIAFVATVAVTVFVTRMARKAIQEKISGMGAPDAPARSQV